MRRRYHGVGGIRQRTLGLSGSIPAVASWRGKLSRRWPARYQTGLAAFQSPHVKPLRSDAAASSHVTAAPLARGLPSSLEMPFYSCPVLGRSPSTPWTVRGSSGDRPSPVVADASCLGLLSLTGRSASQASSSWRHLHEVRHPEGHRSGIELVSSLASLTYLLTPNHISSSAGCLSRNLPQYPSSRSEPAHVSRISRRCMSHFPVSDAPNGTHKALQLCPTRHFHAMPQQPERVIVRRNGARGRHRCEKHPISLEMSATCHA